MSTDADKALVRSYYEEVLTKRDPRLVDDLFSPDYVYHYAGTPSGITSDREGFKQFVTHFLSGYPELKFIVDDQTLEGDQVISHVTAHSSRPVGPVMTIPTDPKQVAGAGTIKGTSTDRIVNGKIVESWLQFDIPDPLPQVEEMPLEEGK